MIDDPRDAEFEVAPTTALATRPQGDVLPVLAKVQYAEIAVQQEFLGEFWDRREHFLQWLLSKMKRGVHYGVPPGCEPRGKQTKEWVNKPSLYFAGATFLAGLFRFRLHPEPDPDTAKMLDRPGVYCCKVTVTDESGEVLGIGRGAFERGEKKMNANSQVKMAEKRAKVAAILEAVPDLRDLFTQDLEDGDQEKLHRGAENQRKKDATKFVPASPNQIDRIASFLEHPAIETDEPRRKWLSDELKKELSTGKAGLIIGKVKAYISDWEKTEPAIPPDEPEREPGQEG